MLNEINKPKIFYHYTSLEALFSITQSKVLRLMSHHSMNDTAELKVHDDLIINTLQGLKNKKNEKEIDSIISQFQHYKKKECFLFCFSESHDILTQWRLYADNSYGVAIGFKEIKGDDYVSDVFSTKCLMKLLYETEDSFKNFMIKQIEDAIKEVENEPSSFQAYAYGITGISFQFKHESFKAEKEHRLLYNEYWAKKEYIPEHIIKNGKMVSFVNKPFTLDQIEEIWITPNFKDRVGLEKYLESIGLSRSIVKEYQTTYKP